MNNKAGGKL